MTVPELSGTQESILAAYAGLIEELGSDDVSYRVIARRAGIAERTVFRNYPTRVDLPAGHRSVDRGNAVRPARSHTRSSTSPSRSARRCSGTTRAQSWPTS